MSVQARGILRAVGRPLDDTADLLDAAMEQATALQRSLRENAYTVNDCTGTPPRWRPTPARTSGNDEGNTTPVEGQTKRVEDFDGSWPPSGGNPTTRLERRSFTRFNRKAAAL